MEPEKDGELVLIQLRLSKRKVEILDFIMDHDGVDKRTEAIWNCVADYFKRYFFDKRTGTVRTDLKKVAKDGTWILPDGKHIKTKEEMTDEEYCESIGGHVVRKPDGMKVCEKTEGEFGHMKISVGIGMVKDRF